MVKSNLKRLSPKALTDGSSEMDNTEGAKVSICIVRSSIV